jgi:hypothetical protein
MNLVPIAVQAKGKRTDRDKPDRKPAFRAKIGVSGEEKRRTKPAMGRAREALARGAEGQVTVPETSRNLRATRIPSGRPC